MGRIIYKNSQGKNVPSVTTVLNTIAKPQLVPWAHKLGLQGIDYKTVRDSSAKAGTLAHDMIQKSLEGASMEDKDYVGEYSIEQFTEAQSAFTKYLEWKSANPFKTLLCEAELVSETFQYGGCIDLYCEFENGEKWLVDHKTSKAVYDSHKYQLAAYQNLLIENGYQVDGCMILRIGRGEDEPYETIKADNIDRRFKYFINLLENVQIEKELKNGRSTRIS